ncbi:quinone oxidoreductase family protein [Deinococcus maricopensis]|uniref:NADPH:quinone reductase n=1 Tax=Deinococcus maricopensis (strain DSM 21211 / LMG 22137 / NRRL B-23946 / LB-34) TaxID=709986 RepID=E8UAH4_DEIML|nr:zinc-binding dehydrogenase [Deinococcus maricopensis]ADV68063.1 NADPH:quinone reductase [Deinococcus maricopensis DSM 21211]
MAHAILVHTHGGPDVLQWQPVPTPTPGPGQVRLRTTLTGVNYADVLARRGGYDAGATPPFTPGLDAVGVIDAVGEGVQDLHPGQRVAAFPLGGAYGTHVLAPAVLTYPLPNDLPDEAASALTPLVTAYNALTRAAHLHAGETVLVHAAAGAVGSLAVQFARALGAARVIGVVSHDARAAFIRALGADPIVHTREDFAERTLHLTGGVGADVILDTVSGDTLERGLTCLAPLGRLVTFGQAGGRPATLRTDLLHRTNRAVIGYSSGHLRKAHPESLRASVHAAFELLRSGRVHVPIDARYPLHDAARAHERVEARQGNGRVLLDAPHPV